MEEEFEESYKEWCATYPQIILLFQIQGVPPDILKSFASTWFMRGGNSALRYTVEKIKV